MVTIGRHVSKLSGYAPALPTLFGSPTIVAPHGSDNPNPQRRRADGGGSGCGAQTAVRIDGPPSRLASTTQTLNEAATAPQS
jgi:hypothetical protein